MVHKRDGHRQHRLAHVSAAALRHKYAILEHELRLQVGIQQNFHRTEEKDVMEEAKEN